MKFYQAIRIDPGKARVVARLTDQTPLLLDQQVGGGHILVFASTFDNVANDFPLHASFVPFVEQTARYLGRLDAGPASVPVGSFEELRDSKETGAAVDVVDPKGDRVLSLAEATKAQNIQFTHGGLLRHPAAQRPQRTGGRECGPPRIRSDARSRRRRSRCGRIQPTGPRGSAGGAAAGEQKPLSLWWYVMVAVLALAVAESLLGNQHLSVDKEAA